LKETSQKFLSKNSEIYLVNFFVFSAKVFAWSFKEEMISSKVSTACSVFSSLISTFSTSFSSIVSYATYSSSNGKSAVEKSTKSGREPEGQR